ncbi:MAG: LemA family protein [Candidatus Binatia bacterium]
MYRFLSSRSLVVCLLALALSPSLSGCGYNRLVTQEEAVEAAWGEVDNQLQRRNDLVPNLVNTVKGFAAQEKEIFIKVTEARSRVASASTPSESIAASNQLSSALSRLLVTVERYPDLKSDQNFMRLQDELAGTENRLAVARMRYNEAVRTYNTTTRRFPTNMIARMFDMEARPYFEVPDQAKAVPQVKF